MKKYTARENCYGHVEVLQEKKYNNQIINITVLYLQYQKDIEGFYESLDNDDFEAINNGYQIDITNNQVLVDYRDAEIL